MTRSEKQGPCSGSMAQTPLWVSGQGGYHTYRIPALVVSTQGTILAFCEGRRDSRSDSGKIDLLLRRSSDGGRNWGETQVVCGEEAVTCGNPCPVVDAATGTIWLPFCKNLSDGPEKLIIEGKAPRTVWVTRSDDDGETWSDPVEITDQTKDPSWTWYATGPCHGIQLADGRMVVPCDLVVGRTFKRPEDPRHSHVIYSDDHGATWRIGGVLTEGTNESCAVETADGQVYLNARNHRQDDKHRAYAWSSDRGDSFGAWQRDPALPEPICQASLTRFTTARDLDKNRVLFANPASFERMNMTVRLSYDECRTWPVAKALHPGCSAYSDLAVAPDMAILCLYERGEAGPYETLTLARFDLEWLTDAADRLA